MSSRSDRVKVKITKAIQINGSLFTVERKGADAYDPATLENRSTTVTYQVYGLLGKPAFRPTSIDGSTGAVKIGQRMTIAAGVEMKVGDLIGPVLGVMTVIASIEPAIVDGEIVSYEVLVTQ